MAKFGFQKAVKFTHDSLFDGVGPVCTQSGGSYGGKNKIKTGSSNQQVDWNVT